MTQRAEYSAELGGCGGSMAKRNPRSVITAVKPVAAKTSKSSTRVFLLDCTTRAHAQTSVVLTEDTTRLSNDTALMLAGTQAPCVELTNPTS